MLLQNDILRRAAGALHFFAFERLFAAYVDLDLPRLSFGFLGKLDLQDPLVIMGLHGFGIKLQGLRRYGHLLTSADSLAWSFAARRLPRLPGCAGRHRTCANCPVFAYRWRSRLVDQVREGS